MGPRTPPASCTSTSFWSSWSAFAAACKSRLGSASRPSGCQGCQLCGAPPEPPFPLGNARCAASTGPAATRRAAYRSLQERLAAIGRVCCGRLRRPRASRSAG
eukprot:3849680-Alexandrium_andersonii.AAC.1